MFISFPFAFCASVHPVIRWKNYLHTVYDVNASPSPNSVWVTKLASSMQNTPMVKCLGIWRPLCMRIVVSSFVRSWMELAMSPDVIHPSITQQSIVLSLEHLGAVIFRVSISPLRLANLQWSEEILVFLRSTIKVYLYRAFRDSLSF